MDPAKKSPREESIPILVSPHWSHFGTVLSEISAHRVITLHNTRVIEFYFQQLIGFSVAEQFHKFHRKREKSHPTYFGVFFFSLAIALRRPTVVVEFRIVIP